MPRRVLVEFDDNDAAKKFVERVNGVYGQPTNDRDFRITAVWAVPTKFCECEGGRDKMFPFSRGVKSGWWLHVDCGRPTRRWAIGNHWFASIGRNLLPGNADWVPIGWGIRDPNDTSGAGIHPLSEMPTERGQRKAKRRRDKKRSINPRRV